jgi:hypothetical protein
MTPFIGFTPDIDPATPGAIVDCVNVVPSVKGMQAAKSLQSISAAPNALPSECIGSAIVRKLDDSRRVFAATATRQYELIASVWTDVSRLGNYSGGVDSRVRYAQFGDVTITANGTEKLQASTTGAFADIAQAPAARTLCTADGFVLAAGTSATPDQWHCSDRYNHITWTPASNNQAANGRLLETPGAIRGLVTLGQYVVAYKERSMYLGRYIDPTIKWAWQLVPFNAGALSQESVIEVDGYHLFLGLDNIYMYDGSTPQPIADNQVREWFIANSDPNTRFRAVGMFDRTNRLAYWFFNGISSSSRNLGLVYHVDKGRWGKVNYSVQSPVNFISPATTINQLTNIINSYVQPLNSPFFIGGSATPSVFDNTNSLKALSGVPGESKITIGDIGNDDLYTRVTRFRPHFLRKPASASFEHNVKNESAGNYAVVGTSSYSADSGFDVLYEARRHRGTMTCTGEMEIIGMDVETTTKSL